MANKKPPRLLTPAELQLIDWVITRHGGTFHSISSTFSNAYSDYFQEARRQNGTRQLITHQRDDWVETIMNFRDGASTVIGTLCEYIAHLCYLKNNHNVEPLYQKGFQLADMDFLIDTDYCSSIKKFLGNNNRLRLGLDYFKNNGKSVQEIVFVRPDACECFVFPIGPIRTHFGIYKTKQDNGYFYEDLHKIKPYKVWTL